jgi:transmembrane sensor
MNDRRSDSYPPRDPAIETAAAEWLVCSDRGLTPAQQDGFLQWLAASPAHRESFERHRRMWADCDALAQWRPEHSAEPNPDLLARPRSSTVLRWWAPVALAAAAAVAVLVWQSGSSAPEQSLAFEATSYRQETLADGSVLDLKSGAHVVVQFTAAERRVLLVQGEALFTVAKNPARPFVVRAGGVDVRAVGTAFNVRIAGPRIELLVTEGTVQVARPSGTPAGPTSPVATVVASLSAGHRTAIPVEPAAAAPVVEAVSAEETAHWLEWKPQMLDFESTSLAEVVAVFNRHNRVQLTIGDETLRTLPIVASIRSDNVDGFVRLLEATSGVRAERRDSEIILRRAR